MDINSISSLTSAQTKLMLANVKTKVAETALSEEKTSTSNTNTSAAKAKTTLASALTASTTATATDVSSTASNAAKIAELTAKFENGLDLSSEEIKYLSKVSPGAYEKLIKQRTEIIDYKKAVIGASSGADVAAIHMNKLSDLLTETKSIANDSSLSDEEKFKMYQSISTRLNAVEDITSMSHSGSSDAQSSAAFQSLLSASSNASQQATMLHYNKNLAIEMRNTTDETTSYAASTVSSTAKPASKTGAESSTAAASTEKTAEAPSPEKTATAEKAKTASKTASEIRTIISIETTNAAQNGVKTAGLNLLV